MCRFFSHQNSLLFWKEKQEKEQNVFFHGIICVWVVGAVCECLSKGITPMLESAQHGGGGGGRRSGDGPAVRPRRPHPRRWELHGRDLSLSLYHNLAISYSPPPLISSFLFFFVNLNCFLPHFNLYSIFLSSYFLVVNLRHQPFPMLNHFLKHCLSVFFFSMATHEHEQIKSRKDTLKFTLTSLSLLLPGSCPAVRLTLVAASLRQGTPKRWIAERDTHRHTQISKR